jgi:shikimate kinase
VLDEALRQRLRDGGYVVWLRAGVATLLARLGTRVRPELGDDPAAGLRRMSAERAPLMEQLADLVLDVDLLTPGQAARQLVDALPSQPR